MLGGFFNAYFFRLLYAPNSEICAQNCFFPVLMLAHMLAFFRPFCSVYTRFRQLYKTSSWHLNGFPDENNINTKPLRGSNSCFSHSAHWLPTPKKLLYTVANPARGLLDREKKKKKKNLAAPPQPPRAARSQKKKEAKKSRGASTYLGPTHVGVTQVVSVRLASVQGFLRRLVG